jgi:hypothetical protein
MVQHGMRAITATATANGSKNRLLRTQVIPIYNDNDDADGCPLCNIYQYCHKLFTTLLDQTRDRRQWRRGLFAVGLLLMTVSIVIVRTIFYASAQSVSLSMQSSSQRMKETASAVMSSSTNTLSEAAIIPQPFDNIIANLNESFEKGRDIAYFFHIPRAAGSTVKDILGKCAYIRIAWNSTYMDGLRAAADTQLVQSGSIDLITTQYLHEGAVLLFDGMHHRGRCFTFMRHPIERAVSLFHYLGIAKHEPTYDPQLQYISIEMWARSKRIEHNWMTRFLSNDLDGDLTPTHLEIAKKVLRRKCLVGLLDEKAESWLRFEKYFGWKFYNEEMRECQDKLLNWGWSNKHQHDRVQEGSVAWELLYKQNRLDMDLYNYAKQVIFEEQKSLFASE